MSARKHIGLEIGDSEFRIVELRADNDGSVISQVGLQQTEYNFGSPLIHDAPYNRTIAKAFIRDMTTLFNEAGFQAQRVSVAMPASSMLVATIPVDPRGTQAEKREQLSWECRMLYGLETDVDVDVRSVVLSATEDAEQHLVAAMPAQTNVFLRSVFQQLAFTVNDLDIDHFVIENCIAERITGMSALTYAVIGMYEEFCSVGVYKNGNYLGFRQGQVHLTEGYFAQALRIVQQVLEGNPDTELEAVFAFGSATTDPLLDSLRTLLKIPVTKYDPLAGIPFLTTAVQQTVSSSAPNTFDVPVGAAMLGLQ